MLSFGLKGPAGHKCVIDSHVLLQNLTLLR